VAEGEGGGGFNVDKAVVKQALTSALETLLSNSGENREPTQYNHKSQPEVDYSTVFLLSIQKQRQNRQVFQGSGSGRSSGMALAT
jgi:hypothetical protein